MASSEDLFGAEHVERYRATDGEEGYAWREGTTILLLTTTGRRSGEPRTTPLIFRPWGDDASLVVASKGGADEPPAWFSNLEEDPSVEVQIRGDRFRARARIATPSEKPPMWAEMVDAWPHYEDYQARTDREIPIVVLERA